MCLSVCEYVYWSTVKVNVKQDEKRCDLTYKEAKKVYDVWLVWDSKSDWEREEKRREAKVRHLYNWQKNSLVNRCDVRNLRSESACDFSCISETVLSLSPSLCTGYEWPFPLFLSLRLSLPSPSLHHNLTYAYESSLLRHKMYHWVHKQKRTSSLECTRQWHERGREWRREKKKDKQNVCHQCWWRGKDCLLSRLQVDETAFWHHTDKSASHTCTLKRKTHPTKTLFLSLSLSLLFLQYKGFILPFDLRPVTRAIQLFAAKKRERERR